MRAVTGAARQVVLVTGAPGSGTGRSASVS